MEVLDYRLFWQTLRAALVLPDGKHGQTRAMLEGEQVVIYTQVEDILQRILQHAGVSSEAATASAFSFVQQVLRAERDKRTTAARAG